MSGTTPRAAVLRAAGGTDPGLQRDNNEDRFHVDEARGLFMVVDGVGGQAAGGEAAELALSMLRARLERETGPVDERVREAITVANNEVHRAAASRPDWKGMACVLTVAVIKDGIATVGHVGDTRLYKLRQGRIEKVTRDHSPVGEREDAGELSEADAMRHPRRNEVYRDVGSELHEPGDADFVDIVTVPVEADAALLLCSDGLSDLVPSATISAIATRAASDPARVVQGLVEAANQAGGKDNVTVIFVEGERFAAVAAQAAPAVRRSWAKSLTVQAAVVAFLLAVAGYALARVGVLRWPAESVTLPSLLGSGVIVVQEGESISAAIEQARAGSQVIVEPGEYHERLRLKDGVRVVSRIARKATLRMPVGTPEVEPAVVARDVTAAELSGFRIIGDASSPLGTGVLVERADVSLVDLEVLGAMTAAVELGAGASGSVVGVSIHDNPGAGLVIRSGADSRISHSGFNKNGMSERISAPVIVEAGARARLEQNVFAGITPEVFHALPADAAAAALRENWFPGVGMHVNRAR
ncbi:MAG TPA: protein phosphatase 2C domain-containing protein [Vicinamibacterales bacterium]|jgi:serine/threonine protein phosphatase PrpC|nr:protein phosphatase 2C domain-containing protein [Vicinamibacterales bacterium]